MSHAASLWNAVFFVGMIRTIAVQGYRSLRELVLPLGPLTLITGANGSGKSSVYRSLRLLADTVQNAVVASLAREGGLSSTFWAGPETISRGVRQGQHPVEGLHKRNSASLKLGFAGDEYGYSIDLGYPPPEPSQTMFGGDPRIKRECLWYGPIYRKSVALVNRRNNYVWLSTLADEEPVMLTQQLLDTDSMLSSIADPARAPEMLAVREAMRSWRFYDHFRTDGDSPARLAQIGTFTPVLHADGGNLASALQTIVELRSDDALEDTIQDAFPGSRLEIIDSDGRFEVRLRQHGLLRALAAGELSDGTLRYLLWAAALLTVRPPQLLVLNEPETSLHPDLLPPLARLIARSAKNAQITVVSHSTPIIESLQNEIGCSHVRLAKSFGETIVEGATLLNTPKWNWPTR